MSLAEWTDADGIHQPKKKKKKKKKKLQKNGFRGIWTQDHSIPFRL